MTIELRRPDAGDIPELGRICYEAFRDIAESHGFPPDFASPEFGALVVGLMMQQEQVHSAGAYDGTRPRGSNFINMWGDVAGIGPISVDLDAQGEGIGRTLMAHVVEHARGQGFEMIRLCQDAFNMRSLALYASLGFEVKEPLAYLELSNAGTPDAAFRPATAADYHAMDGMCRAIYGISRKGEVAALGLAGFPAFVIDRGHVAGYIIPGPIGHAVAESDDVMLALLASLGAGGQDGHMLMPLRCGDLYKRALAAGHRNIKTMNLMALGPYEEPQGTWCPSVMF